MSNALHNRVTDESLLGLLEEMVKIPSFSREEASVADLLETWLSDHGLPPHRKGNNPVWDLDTDFVQRADRTVDQSNDCIDRCLDRKSVV